MTIKTCPNEIDRGFACWSNFQPCGRRVRPGKKMCGRCLSVIARRAKREQDWQDRSDRSDANFKRVARACRELKRLGIEARPHYAHPRGFNKMGEYDGKVVVDPAQVIRVVRGA